MLEVGVFEDCSVSLPRCFLCNLQTPVMVTHVWSAGVLLKPSGKTTLSKSLVWCSYTSCMLDGAICMIVFKSYTCFHRCVIVFIRLFFWQAHWGRLLPTILSSRLLPFLQHQLKARVTRRGHGATRSARTAQQSDELCIYLWMEGCQDVCIILIRI